MLNGFARIGLSICGHAPMLALYAAASAGYGESAAALGLGAAAGLTALAGWELLRTAVRQIQKLRYRTETVEPARDRTVELMTLYMLPVLVSDPGELHLNAAAVIGVLGALGPMAGSAYLQNPLLALLGYRFYKTASRGSVDHLLITKRRIYRCGENVTAVRIADHVLVETEAPNEGGPRAK